MSRIIIPGRLPGYNQLRGGSWQESARIKRKAMDYVMWIIKAAKVEPISQEDTARVRIKCFEPDMRRDEDNVLFGASKIILDAMQRVGVLCNDNRRHCRVDLLPVEVDRQMPRIEVEITANDEDNKA